MGLYKLLLLKQVINHNFMFVSNIQIYEWLIAVLIDCRKLYWMKIRPLVENKFK